MRFRLIHLVLTGFLLAGVSSCREDADIPVADPGKEVTITLSIPRATEAGSPVTYAMPADEATVNTVDVLVFKTDPMAPNDPSAGSFLYRAAVGHTPGSTYFTARFSAFSDNQTIVVLANCRAEVNTLMAAVNMGDTKAGVIQSLSLSRATAFNPSAMDGISMWGEITDQHITESYNPSGLTVPLTRMLAKIDIVNNDAANFTLQEAYLYNPRQKGSMIPGNWNGTNAVTAPTTVTGSEMPQGTFFTPLAPFTTSSANKIENKIYTFEADNAAKAASDLLDATCVIVGGSYRGSSQTYYYRIDLKNYTTGTFFNILRNHRYGITISSVDEEGADNADQAYKGISKIKATVEIWNQATGDAQYGSSHLYVSQRYPWLKLDGTTEPFTDSKLLKIKTNDPAGWQWKNDATTQATLTAFNVTTTGGTANTEVTVVWSPADITSTNPAGRDGKAVIVSGNLEYTVYFMQDNCGRKGIALPQLVGTTNYYKTHRYGTACWMVENLKEGTYFARYYQNNSSYDNGAYYTYIIDPCPTGWRMPSDAEYVALKNAVNADLTNTGRWWAGPLGAANGAFAGYTTSANLWGGWMTRGFWWVNTGAKYMHSNEDGFVAESPTNSQNRLSVRCVKH